MAEEFHEVTGPDAFVEQARWLLEWHNRRSESFVNRSIAILGFDGVALSILFQTSAGYTRTEHVAIGLVVAALLFSAVAALVGLWTQPVITPRSTQLREWWTDYRHDCNVLRARANIAESFLNSDAPDEPNPLTAARHSADKRAAAFKLSVVPLALVVPILALLAADVLPGA